MVLDRDVIQDARYLTDGCYATMACGGMLTRMIKGMTLSEALNLNAEALIAALGGLPKGHIHCADLAVKTLLKVVQDRKIDEPLILPDNSQPEE